MMEGKAQLQKATQDRQIMVQEAQATFDSSELLAKAAVVKAEGEAKAAIARAKGEAQAKIENAKGEAEANQVVSASIDFDYNIYLWIKALNNGRNSVVYVATEGGVPLPVTEAGKRHNAESPEQPAIKVQDSK
jgi:regulator of protease activity HflC (stomatin/prohibitin superfamily)